MSIMNGQSHNPLKCNGYMTMPGSHITISKGGMSILNYYTCISHVHVTISNGHMSIVIGHISISHGRSMLNDYMPIYSGHISILMIYISNTHVMRFDGYTYPYPIVI